MVTFCNCLFTAPRNFSIVECSDCSITIEWDINDQDDCLEHELNYRIQETDRWTVEPLSNKDWLAEKMDNSFLPEAINQLSEGDKFRYNTLMQSSKCEKRYFVRIMIVGKESAGKTCLLRRLLKEDISDVTSTDGVDIVVRRCKINIEDGKWTIGKEIDDDKISRIKRALIPNPEDRETQNMQIDDTIENPYKSTQ
ncbi:unnamed protein product [Mytilus edulis]|uniref:Fibronectin type-III domain-containing protein n=1 Tax=Mytilus edulis TaxID=6550 RepID=A0A8S3R354_MYTED|nr:unnamed protein product [Mytilus edulis]